MTSLTLLDDFPGLLASGYHVGNADCNKATAAAAEGADAEVPKKFGYCGVSSIGSPVKKYFSPIEPTLVSTPSGAAKSTTTSILSDNVPPKEENTSGSVLLYRIAPTVTDFSVMAWPLTVGVPGVLYSQVNPFD